MTFVGQKIADHFRKWFDQVLDYRAAVSPLCNQHWKVLGNLSSTWCMYLGKIENQNLDCVAPLKTFSNVLGGKRCLNGPDCLSVLSVNAVGCSVNPVTLTQLGQLGKCFVVAFVEELIQAPTFEASGVFGMLVEP